MQEIERLRAIIQEHLLAGTPLADALAAVADQLEATLRGLDALAEQVEELQAAVLPRDPAQVGEL
jgi:hypothetical protein